jgi:hypothetical protein
MGTEDHAQRGTKKLPGLREQLVTYQECASPGSACDASAFGTAPTTAGDRRWRWPRVLLLAGALFVLDDAFIHLRIAQTLSERGFYSFNATFRRTVRRARFTHVARAVLDFPSPPAEDHRSAGVHGVASGWPRALCRAYCTPTWLWFVPAAVASPLAIRWLTDGMETGIVALQHWRWRASRLDWRYSVPRQMVRWRASSC